LAETGNLFWTQLDHDVDVAGESSFTISHRGD
jgi:hypothetical protein